MFTLINYKHNYIHIIYVMKYTLYSELKYIKRKNLHFKQFLIRGSSTTFFNM